MPRGSLTVRGPRELLVGRPADPGQLAGVFEPDGTPAIDAHLARGGEIPALDVSPGRMTDEEVTHVDEREVVWGGAILPHYGHFLCESVSRLWPLLPGARLDGLPVVLPAGGKLGSQMSFARDWLDAFGARVVELPEQGAVRFTRMLVPEQAWRFRAWIAPEIRDIHLHARRGMRIPSAPRHDVIWLSRSALGRYRVPYDEALLEWILGSRVTIATPETLPLAEQAALFEGSRAVAGVVGSAFHTLLMTARSPDCLYLCPPWVKASFPAQHRLIDTRVDFAPALSAALSTRPARERGLFFPFGFRLTIPAALRALGSTVLPTLLDDPRIAAFADPGRHRRANAAGSAEDALDPAVTKVLLEPESIPARLLLGEAFARRGLARCAEEQLRIIADLGEESADGPLHTAAALAGKGQLERSVAMARHAITGTSGSSCE